MASEHDARRDASDRALLERAQRGDEEALQQLLDRLRPFIAYICRDECLMEQDAEDAIQITLLRVIQRLHRLRVDGAFARFIAATARNTCRDINRRSRTRAKRERRLDAAPDTPAGDESKPFPNTAASRFEALLRRCLVELAAQCRDLLTEHFLLGKPQKELLAERPQEFKSKQTLSRRVRQCCDALRACLQRHNVSEEDAREYLDGDDG